MSPPTNMYTAQRELLDLAFRRAVNVGPLERAASVLLGTRCALRSFHRGRLGSLLSLGAGCYFLFRGFTGRCTLYRALGLVHDKRYPFRSLRRPVRIATSLDIASSPAEVYRFCRSDRALAAALASEGVIAVETVAPDTMRWLATAGGMELEWTTRIVEDVEPRSIAWETNGGLFKHRGRIEFLPALRGSGTMVVLDMTWFAPQTVVVAALERSRLSPSRRARRALRNVKELLEAGEVAVNGTLPERARRGRRLVRHEPGRDMVDESSRDSFPASDPPSWTPITAVGAPSHPESFTEVP